MKKQLPLYKPLELPKLTLRAIDLFHSRQLSDKERSRLLAMLGPDHKAPERCAAAYITAKLGIAEAGKAMERMLREGKVQFCLRERFSLSIAALSEMEKHGELPHPEEHLSILMRARNSDDHLERAYADRVLHCADIKYGTPGPDFATMKLEPDFFFREGEVDKHTSWLQLPMFKPGARKSAKTGTGKK
jgi:hypothetical protein